MFFSSSLRRKGAVGVWREGTTLSHTSISTSTVAKSASAAAATTVIPSTAAVFSTTAGNGQLMRRQRFLGGGASTSSPFQEAAVASTPLTILHHSHRHLSTMREVRERSPELAAVVLTIARNSGGGGAPIPIANLIGQLGPKTKDAIFRSGKGVEGFLKEGAPAIEIVVQNGIKCVTCNVPDAFKEAELEARQEHQAMHSGGGVGGGGDGGGRKAPGPSPSSSSAPSSNASSGLRGGGGGNSNSGGSSAANNSSIHNSGSSSSSSAAMGGRADRRKALPSGLLPPLEGVPCPLSSTERQTLERLAVDRCLLSYRMINEMFQICRCKCSYDDFFNYINNCGQFWNVGRMMRVRKEGELQPPSNVTSTAAAATGLGNVTSEAAIAVSRGAVDAATAATSVTRPSTGADTDVSATLLTLFPRVVPSIHNNFGGWAAPSNVPTEEDVFEILRFVPIHWGNLGAMNVPQAIKKKHVRIASFLQWLRRQPKFFEVRNVAGTLEIRRSIVLHPEHHGKTQEEANAWLVERLRSGEHNCVSGSSEMGTGSLAATALYKFLLRVAPGYFVAPELIFMRYTKRGLSTEEIVQVAREHAAVFEVCILSDRTPLLRRRTGADSSRWLAEFVADVESIPGDLRPLVALMGRSSVVWDRPEYLYVRLLEGEKILVGGYDNMLAIMHRHPLVFRMGTTFFRRVDPSDPMLSEEAEPSGQELTPRQVEENVYVGHRDLATVFHYVSPDDGPVNAAQLSECCSPAMRACLPPRVVTVLQMFPDLFHCKETAPGVFNIRKVSAAKQQQQQQQRSTSNSAAQQSTVGGGGARASAQSLGGGVGASKGSSNHSNTSAAMMTDEDDSMMMDDDDDGILSRADTVAAVRALIPERTGSSVEVDQLGTWLSLSLRRSVQKHYDSLQSLIDSNRGTFATGRGNTVSLVASSAGDDKTQ